MARSEASVNQWLALTVNDLLELSRGFSKDTPSPLTGETDGLALGFFSNTRHA